MKQPVATYRKRRKGEEGVILFMVILLVVMFSGLGILAMRHTQGELRSSNAYMDSTQAAAAAESAIMMMATDMRRNWRYPNQSSCLNYYARFQEATANQLPAPITTAFSDVFNPGDAECENIGYVPEAGFRGASPLAATGGPLNNGYASVSVSQAYPIVAPPPPGFSSDDAARTYDWYYFTVTSQAAYGFGSDSVSPANNDGIIRGNAVVRSHMKIGPVDSLPAAPINASED